jgi:pimeloyl-ACP methyl ester carboxylesterase
MEEFSTLSAHRVRYRIEGSGPEVVLIHGVGNRLEVWDDVVAALGGRWRTIRYDLRGHGESAKPPGPYHIDDFVSDLTELLSELGLERCHVVGFSLGGLVAQGFALAHSDRLARLVLLSTVAGRSEAERRRVLDRLAIVAEGIPGRHFEHSVDRWFSPEFQRTHPEAIRRHAQRNKLNDPQGYAAAYEVLATCDFADRLHEINRPTLIATGEADLGSNPRMARLMHERIEGSRLHILDGLRHSIIVEAPVLVAELIEEFLAPT